jgi:hypothetical protein
MEPLRQISESANQLSSVSARRPCSFPSAGTMATYEVRETRAALYITPKAVFVQAAKLQVGKRKLENPMLKPGINIWVTSSGKTDEKQHWFLVPVIPFSSTIFDGLTVIWTIHNLGAFGFVFPRCCL